MRNKVVKKLLMIAMAVTMISGTSLVTVYANANPPAEETTTAVVEETTTEKSKDTEKAEDTGRVTGESNNSAFSTPGNAQLVDDKENDDTKQFLTIQTKKGNTFYMVIDRSSNTENVYMMLICQQLVQATGEEYLYEQTDITVKCQEHDFKARGKIPVQMGFKEVEKAFKQLCVKAEPVEEKEKETSIPAGYEEGMRLFPVKAEKTTHYTSPPKPFNEDTLLAAMETAGTKEFDSETEKKGLGTPATRASIIEKLVSSGYAQRKGKQILPSIEGKELVKVMPEYLKSAVMTAEWENQLLMMEKGQITDTQFMGEITSLVRKILEVCREIPEEERRRFQTEREVIGKCPVCGCDVFEGKQNFYCSNRQCDFALWKENRFLGSMEKNLDKKMARELLDKACTHVKGLYSKKKDMKFDADLLLTLEDGKPRFHLEFPKKKKK